MQYILKNNFLEVIVSEEGAELQSMISKLTTFEYIWQGNPSFWNRRAPVLFPIVGRLVDNTYQYQGINYNMPQHGFARDKQFEMAACGDQEVLLFLTEDNESLQIYPFKFILFINYKLNGNSLEVSYEVKNTNETEMLFSIGGHPGFNCPWGNQDGFEDYEIVLDAQEQPLSWLLEGPFQSGKTGVIPFNNNRIELSKKLFDNDAIVFKNIKSKCISLVNSNTGQYLKMDFENFPYFGIWSKKDCDKFVCLEPWAGIADHLDSNGIFEEKEGIIKLLPNESYHCSYRISVG